MPDDTATKWTPPYWTQEEKARLICEAHQRLACEIAEKLQRVSGILSLYRVLEDGMAAQQELARKICDHEFP